MLKFRNNSKNFKVGFKVGFWNINGLSQEKSETEDFQDFIKNFDIVFLSETWQSATSIHELQHPKEYSYEFVCRTKNCRKGRGSGGILVYYKSKLKNKLAVHDNTFDNILWLKVSKGVICDKEIYIAGVYNSPKNSKYAKNNNCNVLDTLRCQLNHFSSTDILIIGGDFNSRIGVQSDFITEGEKDLNYLPQGYQLDCILSNRNNKDPSMNEYGRQLLDLCIETKLRVLNGRVRGDFQGHLTYIGYHGSSTVDLVLTTEQALTRENIIQYLSIAPLNHLSDHKPVLLSLTANNEAALEINGKTSEDNIDLRTRSLGFFWDVFSRENFEKELKLQTEKLPEISYQLNRVFSKTEVEDILSDIQNTFLTAANSTLKKKNSKCKTKIRKSKHKKWFNFDCQKLLKNLRHLVKSLSRSPNNPAIKGNFFKLKRKYKSTCRKAKRNYEQKLLKDLESLYSSNNTNEFWGILKSIKNHNIGNKNQSEVLPPLEELQIHYQNLLRKGHQNKEPPKGGQNTELPESLNEPFTIDEIKKAIKYLKSNKAPGNDSITNEMIKCSCERMIQKLHTLFNLILDSGHYPNSWDEGLIFSIYKSGGRDNPSNYRGITLSNCLGKLFNSILYQRIIDNVEKENVLSHSQAGFRKNYRTSDHIFTLFSLLKKYLKEGKYFYTCFVDFKKAYDSIWRNGLLHKLEKLGITGKILKVIKSMYSSPNVSLIYGDKITTSFPTNVGLKQGDILSTIFFNLYIDDLPQILNSELPSREHADIPMLNDTLINCLLFADDLALLSLSQVGLQNKINILEKYCQEWGLEINIKKTKVMIFNKQGAVMKKFKFYFSNQDVEVTKQYTYLGFTFVPSGKKQTGIENLINKGRKAWFSIQKMLQKSKEKGVDTYLKLFDSIVKPIITYACECWGDSLKKDVFANKIESFHTRICKQILGVSKFVNNMKVLTELGRTPLSIYIQKQMFKYLQRFPFVDKDRYLYKAFEEDSLDKNGWVKNIKNTLDSYGQSNLIKNIFKVIQGEISEKDYKPKHNFFLKRATDCYVQQHFYNYIDNTENQSFFTELKQDFIKERYLNLHDFEIRKAISKLRLSSHKLAIVTGKWYKIEKSQRICKLCDLDKIENEFHVIFDCPYYEEERDVTFAAICKSENINLMNGEKTQKLRKIFTKGCLKTLNLLGKFFQSIFDKRPTAT